MSNPLNSIQLNNDMLSSLYGHSLVDLTNKRPAENTSRKVVVFVKDSNNLKLQDTQHNFLMQILKACKLDADDVAIVNLADKKIVFEIVIGELAPQYILSFGTGSGTELFTMGNDEGRKYLNAPALDEMMQESDTSKQLKRKTWNELKLLFGI